MCWYVMTPLRARLFWGHDSLDPSIDTLPELQLKAKILLCRLCARIELFLSNKRLFTSTAEQVKLGGGLLLRALGNYPVADHWVDEETAWIGLANFVPHVHHLGDISWQNK